MKMKFNTKKILSLILLSIALVSCNEGLDGFIDSTETTLQDINWAQKYYEQLPTRSTRLGVQKGKSKGVAVRPGWKHTTQEKGSWYSFVETDLESETGFNLVLPENEAKYQETGDGRYLVSQTRYVFRKSPVKEEMFYMTIMPSADFMEKTKFEPFKNMSYMKRDKSFSGLILFHNQNGDFANGWKYKDGLATEAVYKVEENHMFTRLLNPEYEYSCDLGGGYGVYYIERDDSSVWMFTSGNLPIATGINQNKGYDTQYYSTNVNDSYSSNHDYGSYENTGGYGGSPTQDYGYSHVGGYTSSGGSSATQQTEPISKILRNNDLQPFINELRDYAVFAKDALEDGAIVFKSGKVMKPNVRKAKTLGYDDGTVANNVKTEGLITLKIHSHPAFGGGPAPSGADMRGLNDMMSSKTQMFDPNNFIYCIVSDLGDFVITVKDSGRAKTFIRTVFGTKQVPVDENKFQNEFTEYYQEENSNSWIEAYVKFMGQKGGNVDCGLNFIWRDFGSSEWQVLK